MWSVFGMFDTVSLQRSLSIPNFVYILSYRSINKDMQLPEKSVFILLLNTFNPSLCPTIA